LAQVLLYLFLRVVLRTLSEPAMSGGYGETVAVAIRSEGDQALTLFDAIAVDGCVRPREFATIMQREVVSLMSRGAAIALEQPGVPPPLKPAAMPAIERVDGSHLRGLLEMLFRVIDTNKNGSIDRAEFEKFFNSFGLGPETREKVQSYLFSMVDKSGNGKIGVDEAQSLLTAILEIISTLIGAAADVAENVLCSAEIGSLLEGQLEASGMLSVVDTNSDGVVSKEEFLTFLSRPGGPLEGLQKFIETDSAERTQFFTQMKQSRDMLAAFESSSQAQIWVKIKELTQGGVDEATFVGKVSSLMREYIENQSNVDADQAMMLKQVLQMQKQTAATAPPNMQKSFEMSTKAIEGVMSGDKFKPAMKAAMKRSTEYYPEMARAMFQFIDLDGNGSVTSKEISMLKALIDGLLHLGERPIEHPSNTVKPDQPHSDQGKELALTIFDILDRNHDGALEKSEIVAFITKLGCMVCAYIRCLAHQVVECLFDEIGKVLLADGWKQAGMEELAPDDIAAFASAAPVMVMGMLVNTAEPQDAV